MPVRHMNADVSSLNLCPTMHQNVIHNITQVLAIAGISIKYLLQKYSEDNLIKQVDTFIASCL